MDPMCFRLAALCGCAFVRMLMRKLSSVLFGRDSRIYGYRKAYARMMEGNLFGQETGGAALGLDSDGHAVLVRRVPGEVSQEDFASYIESVLNYAEAWLEDLGLSKTEQE